MGAKQADPQTAGAVNDMFPVGASARTYRGQSEALGSHLSQATRENGVKANM